jgi:hypothetical protein
MGERDLTVEHVEREHLTDVHQPAHWAYLAGVIGFGLVVMLLLIALLDAS